MKTYTIGFTKTSAETFFTAIRDAGVSRLIDVRLNNVSQLAGFAKRDDLKFFLSTISRAGYRHELLLAPTQESLRAYQNKAITWTEYEQAYLGALASRKVEEKLTPDLFDGACLLCSEHSPVHCHRRLALDYLASHWGPIEIIHLR